MVRVAFRIDASAQAGGGHAIRSLSLADALTKRDVQTCFFVGPQALNIVPRLIEYETTVLDDPYRMFPSALAKAFPEGVEAVVIDDYGYDAAMQQELRHPGRLLVLIDERLDRRYAADIMIDQTFGRSTEQLRGFVPEDCEILVGGSYALLRPAFAALRPQALARRLGRRDQYLRVLVSMGLTDPDNVTGMVLRELEPLAGSLAIDVAIGAGAPHVNALRRYADEHHWATLHVNHPAIWSLMAAADLAVGGAGVTSWERCCLGLPAIILLLATNQEANGQALAQAGAAAVLGQPKTLTSGVIADAVARLISDDGGRAAMGRAAAAMTDGRGAERVTQRLIERVAVLPAR